MAAAEAEASGTGRSPQSGSVYDGFISYSHAADDLLAPRLQAGLQKFAKPWWKRRALRVFRDESSLAANPHLWSSITEALDTSEWFVLLLSPDAADSPWVNSEIEYWRTNYAADRIIPVLTDGEFSWSDGDVAGSSVPRALQGAFEDEPRWVDLRFARGDEQLDLNNPQFSSAVADLAAPLRGIPKDELQSEEVKQHRRTLRTAWAAGMLLVALAAAALYSAQLASAESREARSRELAASAMSVSDKDQELAVMLALEAARLDQSPQTMSVLHQTLQNHRSKLRIEWAPERLTFGFFIGGAVSPDGNLVALAGSADELEVWDLRNPDGPLWTKTIDLPSVHVRFPRFSRDGSTVFAGAGWPGFLDGETPWDPEAGYGIYGFDAESGEQTAFVATDRCWAWNGLDGNNFVDPDELNLIIGVPEIDSPEVSCSFQTALVGLIDMTDGDIETAVEGPFTAASGSHSMTPDRSHVALGWAEVISIANLETGEVDRTLPGYHAVYSPDGKFMLIGNDPLQLLDTETGVVVREYPGSFFGIGFSADTSLVIGARFDGDVDVYDRASGHLLLRLAAEPALFVEMTNDKSTLVAFGTGATRVYDVERVVLEESGEIEFGSGLTYHVAAALDTAGDVGVTWHWDTETNSKTVHVFSLSDRSVLRRFDGFGAALSQDGQLVAFQAEVGRDLLSDDVGDDGLTGEVVRLGSVRIVDVASGETVAELDGLCEWFTRGSAQIAGKDFGPGAQRLTPECDKENIGDWIDDIEFSPDGTKVALSSRLSESVGVWNASSGALLWRATVPSDLSTPSSTAWSPDGSLVAAGRFGEVIIFESSTGNEIARVPFLGGQPLYEMEFTPDGSLLLGGDQGNRVIVIDTATWEELDPLIVTEGEGVRDLDLTSDGRLLVTAGDRNLRVWDLEKRAMVLEIEINEQIRGVEFIDENHLLVLPMSQTSAVILSLDNAEVIEIAKSRVLRGFTEQECATYGLDPCPTLEELRGG